MIQYREARKGDWDSIKLLISMYPESLMQTHLPSVDKFFVAEDTRILGCCALDIYSKRISEIRSLAVLEDYHEQGIGSKLIEMCLKRAKERGIIEIFTVTSSEKLFNQFGFNVFNNEKIVLFKNL